MGKSTHFSGQPLYSQIIKLLDKSEILRISSEQGAERYVKSVRMADGQLKSEKVILP